MLLPNTPPLTHHYWKNVSENFSPLPQFKITCFFNDCVSLREVKTKARAPFFITTKVEVWTSSKNLTHIQRKFTFYLYQIKPPYPPAHKSMELFAFISWSCIASIHFWYIYEVHIMHIHICYYHHHYCHCHHCIHFGMNRWYPVSRIQYPRY